MKKKCTGKCREIKPLEDFSIDRNSKTGRRSQCKKCIKESRPSRARKIEKPKKKNCMQEWWK